MLNHTVLGSLLALLTTLPLAWRWQLGVRRVACVTVALAVLSGLAVASMGNVVAISAVLRSGLVWVLTLAAAFLVLGYRFYRDPERKAPDRDDVIVSPADGVVIYVRKSRGGMLPVSTKQGHDYALVELTRTPLRGEEAVVIGISMSFSDVHVNRAPIEGRVTVRRHFPGRFSSLRRPEMVFENERATTVIERDGLQVAVVQIASRLVRQIATFVREGQEVALGERIGVIRLGSQVDLVLPAREDLRITVQPGERVRAGESVIGVLERAARVVETSNTQEAQKVSNLSPAWRSGQTVQPMTGQTGALVIGGDYRGLVISRSLGRHGIPVWVLNTGGDLIATTSRYTRRSLPWPAGDDARQLDYLLELSERHRLDGWAIFPTVDETAALLARHHGQLMERFRLTTPPWEVMRWAYDKRLTYRLATEIGVDHPWTRYPASREEVAEVDCTFPVILKPAIKTCLNRFTKDKAWRVDDRDALLARYDKASELVPPDVIMMQELIPGGGEAQFSYVALCADGRPLAWATARRTRQFPVDFGHSSSYVETVDRPEVEEPARRLLGAIRYTGLVEVEFKRDGRDGCYKLLDINARVWTWQTLCSRAGIDFVYLLWLLVRGEPVPGVRGRTGVRWVRMSTDLPAAVSEILRGRLSIRAYFRSLRGPLEYALMTRDDPLPALLAPALFAYLRGKRVLCGRGP